MKTAIEDPVIPSKMLEQNRKVSEAFYGLLMERVHELVLRPDKWSRGSHEDVKENDIVMFLFNDSDSGEDWRLGRVINVEKMAVSIYVKKNEHGRSPVIGIVERPKRKVYIVHSEDEIDLNTKAHKNRILESKN